MALVSKDHDGPNDPLSLSTQQSRLIRQTWSSAAAGSIGVNSNGETQTSSRPTTRKYRNRRGGGAAARPDSINKISSTSAVPSTDKSRSMMFFRHLKNIEKVSKTVDERMRKRKVQKEWSIKVISETARLRGGDGDDSDKGGSLKKKKVDANMHTISERSPSTVNPDMAPPRAVDTFKFDDDNDNDLLGLGTPQSQSDDRDPESMEEEVVPTSQSQERYLSPLGASCVPINGRCAGDF